MPVRCRWREGRGGASRVALAAAAAALLALAGPSHAQLLNLDTPAAPRPNEGKAALELAQSLFDDIAKREKALERLSGDGLLAGRFEIATRRLVRVLLMKAEELGEAGSVQALTALTLHNRQSELDGIARQLRAGRLDPHASAAAELFIAQVDRLQSMVPARADDLDRALRDLLAVPVHTGLAAAAVGNPPETPVWVTEPERVGWVRVDAGAASFDLGAAAQRWSAIPGVPAEVISAIAEFDAQTLAPARDWWAYRPAAETVAAAIIAAGRIVEPGTLPDWVPEATRLSLTARFASAAAGALEPDTRPASMTQLADLARSAEAIVSLDRLSTQATSGARPSQRVVTAARAAVLAIVAALETGSNESRAALTAFERTLRLLSARGQLGTEEAIVRDARPAWRALEAEARRTEMDLWEVLGRISAQGAGGVGAGGGPMSDPAIITPLSAHRRSLDDLSAVATISRTLGAAGPTTPSGPGSTPRPPSLAIQQGLALGRVLRLGQDLTATTKRDAALTALRRLAIDLDELMAFPGEAELRLGGAAWGVLTGGRGTDLVQRIDASRQQWLESWVNEREGAETSASSAAAERLRRCRALVIALHDAATARGLQTASSPRQVGESSGVGEEGGIRAWPGWELSDRAARSLYDGLDGRLARATQLLLEGSAASGDAVDAAIKEFTDTRAPVRLAAALERAARDRRLALAPAMIELAAPPPIGGGVWLADLRAELASFCRYAEELAHASEQQDNQRAAALRAYLNDRAAEVLRRLQASEGAS